jgi:CRISPR-associated protein Csd1
MKPFLNPEHPSPAYHCGRLLAVLASLQRKALPNVEAGVIQRFYAAASATPALVLGRIVRTAQFHLDKVRSDSPGLAEWYESKIASILSAIGDTVPVTLSLEEQSLFALGYYQQMAHDRAGRTAIDQNTTTTEEVSP